MPLQVGLWRMIDDDKPQRITAGSMPTERQLEELIEHDPAILGEPLLIVGRQVPTNYGTYIDLLAVDGDGVVHVLELKRDRTPRDVVAQLLDYGSWVRQLSYDDVLAVYKDYASDRRGAFEVAFEQLFDTPPPQELNTAHQLTIIASELDAATERIVGYLSGEFDVPINAVFFRYFDDDGRQYLARTWLMEQDAAAEPKAASRSRAKEPWNGRDWYVSYGEEPNSRRWEDAAKYGFVCAGGGEWYSRTIRKLPVGARVFVHIPKLGYVGVGTVTGEAAPFDGARVVIDGVSQLLKEQDLAGTYAKQGGEEYVVPVEWIVTRPREQAFWTAGLFANQNSAARLRNRFTLDTLTEEFGLD